MIELVPISEKHKESLVRILNQSEVEKWLAGPPYPYTEADADEFIARCRQSDSTNDFAFAIELDGKQIGGIGIHMQEEGIAFIGYYLDKNFHGKGIATEAVEKIVDFGFNELGLEMIYAHTFEGNVASQKVLEKSGFTEKENPKVFTKNGKTFNSNYFYKLRNK